MTYRAQHKTVYTYATSVSTCHNQVRLRPRRTPSQIVHHSQITVDPEPDSLASFRDYYGNTVHQFSVLHAHTELTISGSSIVEKAAVATPEPSWTPPWESVRNEIRACGDWLTLEAFDFTGESPYVKWTPDVTAWTSEAFEPGRPVLEAALELNSRVHNEFTYVPSSTTIDTPVADVFQMRKGVCQDFAHLMIGSLRSIGLAARYVSGYLRSGGEYTGAEASHAWVAVYVPAAGWIDLDPTNNVMPGDGHITIAWGRDYGDVAPVKGVTLGGGDHRIDVQVQVRPVTAVEAGLAPA